MSGEHFSLVWNTFPGNLSSGLYNLLTGEHLVDVTLAAEGQILRAHKLILSVCSSYFRELFKVNSCKHPIVILKDVSFRDLSAMLHFMYQGEVNIKQEDIPSFLKVAEILQIKGLTKCLNEDGLGIVDEGFDLSLQNQLYSLRKESQKTSSQEETSEKLDSECYCENAVQKTEAQDSQDDCKLLNITENAPSNPASYEKQCDFNEEFDTLEEPRNYKLHNDDLDFHKPSPCKSDYEISMDIDVNVTATKNNNQEEAVNSLQKETTTSDIMEFMKDPPTCSQGKRSIKDIPSSNLSLESTLQAVADVSPTLRMERGKVMRMYSCPWCMRHFTRKENLKLHVKYIHGPLESLTCKHCGNKYKNSNSLRVHSYLYHNTKRNKHCKPALDEEGP